MRCPSCGSNDLHIRGHIPSARYFAGRQLDDPLPGGQLVECRTCALHFRFPRTPQNTLDELYRQGNPEAWQYPPGSRRDWELAWEVARSIPHGGRALDIGCFDGTFLAGLGDNWQRFGIEPNTAATSRAAERGVQIVADTFDERAEVESGSFHLITAFDLVEHLPDPMELVEFAAQRLHPGGRLIIGTGDTNAWTWRLLGASYWYCVIPEHLSFINDRWIRRAGERHAMHLQRLERYSHDERASVARKVRELAANLAHRASPRITSMLRSVGLGGMDIGSDPSLKQFPPLWMSARDHLLAVLQK